MTSCVVWFCLALMLAIAACVFSFGRLERKGVTFPSAPGGREVRALRESESRFRRLAENMRDIAWIVSLDGPTTLFVNRAFERITGRPCQTLYDQPDCLDLVHPEDRAQAVVMLFRQVLEDYPGDAEFRIVRPDDGERWVRCRAFWILGKGGGKKQLGCVAEDITEYRQSEKALHDATTRLLHLQDEERRRIARELHDSTGQMLTALSMNLSALKMPAARLNPKARRTLSETLALARQCLQEVRTISYLLHPPLLDELGLASALANYLDGFTKRSAIRVTLDVPPDFGRLPPDIELALFRVVQESLTNIRRHSGSPTARVKLARDASGVLLEVADKGRGIPPEMLGRNKDVRPGLGVGIAGMKERLNQVNGLLEIESNRRGTVVRAIVPNPDQLP